MHYFKMLAAIVFDVKHHLIIKMSNKTINSNI